MIVAINRKWFKFKKYNIKYKAFKKRNKKKETIDR